MEAIMKNGDFVIRPIRVRDHGFDYVTHQVVGYLNGQRVRRKFKTRDGALGELNRLQVEAANGAGAVRAVNTRLTQEQIMEAEACFQRLTGKPLSLAVDWFLTTYRPPNAEIALETARDSFLADRALHVRTFALRDYRRTLAVFCAALPGRPVHSITTGEVQTFLTARKVGKKRWNNLRGDLHAFFNYCIAAPRGWLSQNPVKPIATFEINRGLPEILAVAKAAELMEYVQTYADGAIAPYFALCLFAGLRPCIPDGEVWKLGKQKDVGRFIDVALKVIRISPEIAKTKGVRSVTIQSNLASWLRRFPLDRFPIVPPNIRRMVQHVREKFALSDDVLRHTMISAHVARFRSLGDTALQAGNSEGIIKKHYLNLLSAADAKKFWAIRPKH